VRRLATRHQQRIRRQPADIAIGGELAPRPAFVVELVDRDALAHQRFGVERRVGRGRAPHRRLRVDHLAYFAYNEACCRDLALKVLGGEIGRAGVMRGSKVIAADDPTKAEQIMSGRRSSQEVEPIAPCAPSPERGGLEGVIR